MASKFDPSQFSQTVRAVRDKLQDEDRVTAARIVAGIVSSHPEYGNHLARKLELDTGRGEQRPVDDWLMDVMNSYAPDLLEQFGQKVIDGRLVIRALARIDTTLLTQDLMEPFLLELEKEINPLTQDILTSNDTEMPAAEKFDHQDLEEMSKTGEGAATGSLTDKTEIPQEHKDTTVQGVFRAEGMSFNGAVNVQKPPLELRAGYWADGEMGEDQLNLDTEVNTLAAVLCDVKITPPLSVGLFGDWGSGKSFFMHLLRQRVAMLAEAARGAEERKEESFFCAHIRQITFNSWHYSDANLWASLVTHIFERLADDEDAGEEGKEQSDEERKQAELERKNLLAELHSAKALERELETAESQNKEVDRDLATVLVAYNQMKIGELLQNPKNQADELAQKSLNKIKQQFGISEESSVEDIRTFVEDSRNLGRSLSIIWTYMKGRKSWTVVLVLLILAASLCAQIQFNILPLFEAAVTTLVGLVAIMKKPMLAFKDVAEDAATILKDVDRRRDEKAERLQKEKELLQERIKNLKYEYEALTSGGRFAHLVAERAQSDTYRKELGIISHIHRDFKQMSDLLLKGREERRAKSLRGELEKQEAKEDEPAIPEIDRIILYIDDLDRCDADRVVKVLEAVHLLMAEPLFVVVVGVDPRWLLRSLEKHYTGLLTTKDGVLNPDVAADWQSTPMNYLEKIFQIPYTLRPMGKTGFERLMESLVPVPKDEELRTTVPDPDDLKKQLVTMTTGKPAGDDWQKEYEKILEDKAGPRQTDEAGMRSDETGAVQEERVLEESLHQARLAQIDIRPRQLSIDSRELEFMKKLGPLIGTPRAAKRLSNIYRLLRASLDDKQLHKLIDTETGDGDYPVVGILLAIVVGYPRVATFVFQKLYYSEEIPDWNTFIEGLVPRDEQEQPLNLNDERGQDGEEFHNSVRPKMTLDEAKLWSRLCRRLERVSQEAGEAFPQDLGLYRKWVFKVARYSFHTGRLVVSNQEDD